MLTYILLAFAFQLLNLNHTLGLDLVNFLQERVGLVTIHQVGVGLKTNQNPKAFPYHILRRSITDQKQHQEVIKESEHTVIQIVKCL